MYTVFLDDEALYVPGDSEAVILNPKLDLALGKSGSFEFDLPLTNPLYSKIKKLSSVVSVIDDGTEIFKGRVISAMRSFENTKSVVCEGELAYLLDSIQEPHEFHDITPRAFLEYLVAAHNAQVNPAKALDITFSPSCNGESKSWDNLSLFYKKDGVTYVVLDKVGAYEIAGKTYTIPTSDFYVYWHTDGSVNDFYGFSITKVAASNAALSSTSTGTLPSYTVTETSNITDVQTPHNPYLNSANVLWHFTHPSIKIGTSSGVDKSFIVGQVTVTDPNDSLYRYTNWENTLDAINDKLVSRLGGRLRVRNEGGVRYLDYLAESDNTNTQVITFGKNLLDFSEQADAADIATRIIPLGAKLDDSPIEGLDAYTTIKSVNDGCPYVESVSAIQNYGIITKTVQFDNVTTPSILKTKGQQYLTDTQFETLTLEIGAVDLSLQDASFERIKLGDDIRVLSPPHGMNRVFPVTALTLYLDAPEKNTVRLGDSYRASFTERSVKQNEQLVKQVQQSTSPAKILASAKSNATALIAAATTGHVVTRPNELLIMDTADMATARKVWRWNSNGLGYSNTGYNGTYGLAMTIDGAIVADRITTGTLNAAVIKTGILSDAYGNISWNLNTGAMTAKNLSINSPYFTLSSYGYLTASGATINGTVTAEYGDSKAVLDAGRVMVSYNGKDLGFIGANSYTSDPSKCGINFDLNSTGDYMTWAAKDTASSTYYNMKWTYAKNALNNYSAGMLHAGCDIDMHNWKLRNVSWPDGAINGTCNFVRIASMNSDGRCASWSTGCYMQFKNGILIKAAF